MTFRERAGPADGIARSPADEGHAAPSGVSHEAVVWAFRFLVGREPAGEKEIAFHAQHKSLVSLRTALMQSREFEALSSKARGVKRSYAIPAFLLRPAAEASLRWRFEQPTLEDPVCQLCTASQFEEPAFAEISQALGLRASLHRKVWETAYIISTLATAGMISPECRGLGIGCTRERIPALLASRGVQVLATGTPSDDAQAPEKRALDFFYPEVIALEDFEQFVTFREMDPGALPPDFAGRFDFCWSMATAERRGTLDQAMEFVEASLETLRPGGLAVHTTEFNLGSNEETAESGQVVVLRRRDIEALAARLIARGHEVLPINLHPGHEPADELIDAPPYGLPHLKLQAGGHTLTSIGIVVRKAG
jgi:hypothetical protein